MRWARVAALGFLVAAACTSESGPSAAGQGSPGIAACQTSQLDLVGLEHSNDALMGSRIWYFAFVNKSDDPCRLDGYPTATLYAGDRPLTTDQVNGGWSVTRSDRPGSVRAEPGARVYFGVVDHRCDPERFPEIGSSTAIAAAPPGSSDALRAPVEGIPVCSDRRVGVSAVRDSIQDV